MRGSFVVPSGNANPVPLRESLPCDLVRFTLEDEITMLQGCLVPGKHGKAREQERNNTADLTQFTTESLEECS